MRLRRYSNTAADTTLNGAITSASTSLTVGSAANWPSAPFTLAVDSEIILVTEVSGLVFKGLTRGYDDTVADSHVDGSTVEHKAIADDFSYRWYDTLTVPTWHSLDDEFDDNNLSADWTEVTPFGTVAWTEARGVLSARLYGVAANRCCALVKGIGSLTPPLYVYTPVRLFGQIIPSVNNYLMAGPLFSDGTTTTSNVVWYMPHKGRLTNDTDYYTSSLRAGTFSNIFTSQSSTPIGHNVGGWLHLRLDWVAAGLWKAWVSPDGVSWTALGQTNWSHSMTPTHVGVGVSTWYSGSALPKVVTVDSFRVYESRPSWWEDGT